jgi:cell division protein FtsL
MAAPARTLARAPERAPLQRRGDLRAVEPARHRPRPRPEAKATPVAKAAPATKPTKPTKAAPAPMLRRSDAALPAPLLRRGDVPAPRRMVRAPRRTPRPDQQPLVVQARRGDGGLVRRDAVLAAPPVTMRPMERATRGIEADDRTRLTVVPRRRSATRWAAVLCGVLVVAMAGAAAFQTSLAQRQVQLDKLDHGITVARQQYDQLRRERAQLRSPQRLAGIAKSAGMVSAQDGTYLVMSPDVVATVQESAGGIDPAQQQSSSDPLGVFREVKSVTGAAP